MSQFFHELCSKIHQYYRRFGAFDDRRFCFEGGSRCSFKGGEGVFVLGSNKSRDIGTKFELAVRGRLSESHRFRSNPTSPPSGNYIFLPTCSMTLIILFTIQRPAYSVNETSTEF